MITAGSGNETLAVGSGDATLNGSATDPDVFNFVNETGGKPYIFNGAHSGDLIYFATADTASYAAAHQTIGATSNTVSLADGTTIVFEGITIDVSGAIGHG